MTLNRKLFLAFVSVAAVCGIFFFKNLRFELSPKSENKELPSTMSTEFVIKIPTVLDTVTLKKCNALINLKDSTELPDSIKILIFNCLDNEKMPYDKAFYLNFVCYLFRKSDYFSYRYENIIQFSDCDRATLHRPDQP